MKLGLVSREPGVPYLDTHLWVPLDTDPDILSILRRKYRFLQPTFDHGKPEFFYLWRQTPHHLLVPRTAVVPGLKPVDLRPTPKSIEPVSKITLDWKGGITQKESVAAWLRTEGGILNLGCGKGKTVCALEAVTRSKVATLVVVHTTLLYKQWLKMISEHLGNVSVGTMQGDPNTWSWDQDIVVAMLNTLFRHHNQITPEIRRRFGYVIFDEVHRLPSEEYHVLSDLFLGRRYGLTATIKRADSRDHITRHNLGPVFYSDLEQISPTIYFQMVNFRIDMRDPAIASEVKDVRGVLNTGKIRTFVGKYPERNKWLARYILWLRDLGRQVLVLTHSRDQVYILRDMLTERGVQSLGICTGLEGTADRMRIIEENKLIIGTAQIAGEGLDKQELDTLLLLSPVGRDVAGENAIQQSTGRILRPVVGKNPVVIFIHDVGIQRFHKMSIEMAHALDRWPKDKGGPLPYTYVPSDQRPEIPRGQT